MDPVIVLLIGLVVGVALGGLVGWLLRGAQPVEPAEIGEPVEDPAVTEARHQRVVAEVRAEELAARARAEAESSAARASVEAELAGVRASLAGVRDQLTAAREQFATTVEQHREQHATTVAQHREQLAATVAQHREADRKREAAAEGESKVLQQLTPVAAQLKDMQRKIVDLEKQRHEQHGDLNAQIRATRESADQSRAAAQTLSAAMRNNSVRGAYGETQLKTLVESAGLLNRVDFSTQESITADSGARRPDMVVQLPGRKQVALDAKVPYNAFIDSHREDLSASERSALRVQHAKALKSHVDALSGKEYWTGLTSSPEFTIAFIPSEAILNAALEADPSLLEHAFGRGIVLATPSNLWSLLKTVALTWKQEDLAENAQELVDLGRELYKRLGTLSTHVSKLGRSIESTVKSYNDFAGSLEGRVLVTARRLDGIDEAKLLGEVKQIEADPRRLTATEFTVFDDVERPEIEPAIIEGETLFDEDDQTA